MRNGATNNMAEQEQEQSGGGNGCAWALGALFALFGLGVLVLLLLPMIFPHALRLIPH